MRQSNIINIATISGSYDISAQALIQGTFIAASGAATAIFVDGTSKISNSVYAFGASQAGLFPQVNVKSLPLLAGQVITIRTSEDSVTSPVFNPSTSNNWFSISRSGN